MAPLFSKQQPSGLKFTGWLFFVILIIALDQISKYYFQHTLEPYERLPVTSFFNLVLAHNTGAAFSFLAEAGGWQRWLFAGLALIVTLVILFLLKRFNQFWLFSLSLSLIAAGALGNLIDRATLGYVIDFIDLHAAGYHWPAFNVADIAICAGAVGLVIDEIFGLRKR